MTDETRTALLILAWLATIALAFVAGRIWRERPASVPPVPPEFRPVVIRVPRSAIRDVELVSGGGPDGALVLPKDDEPWRPKRESTTIPVRGSDWESELDWERRQGAAQARA